VLDLEIDAQPQGFARQLKQVDPNILSRKKDGKMLTVTRSGWERSHHALRLSSNKPT